VANSLPDATGYSEADSELARYDYPNLQSVLAALGRSGYDGVRLACYNRAEAKFVYDRLTPEQRRRVHFTWWNFGLESEKLPLDGL
jgi:hypothetical protein